MHKVFFRFNHSPLVFIAHSVAHTHTHTRATRYLLLLNQVRDPLTHIYRGMCMCIRKIYVFFWTGQFVSFHQQRQHTCSCVCVCVTICHSDCARHQKSKMAAHFLQIQNAKNKKNKMFFF